MKSITYMYSSENDPDDESDNGGRLTAGIDDSIRYIGLQQQSIDTTDSVCMYVHVYTNVSKFLVSDATTTCYSSDNIKWSSTLQPISITPCHFNAHPKLSLPSTIKEIFFLFFHHISVAPYSGAEQPLRTTVHGQWL